MPTNSPASPEHVAAAVVALRSFWETGRASWAMVQATANPDKDAAAKKKKRGRKRKTGGYVHGNKIEMLMEAAADEGMNYDTLQKAWRAAQQYTQDQIEELCALVEEHRARFGPTHLTRVMAVADRRKRDSLTRRAIRGRWGVTRLERVVQAVNGRRPHVGKRPAIPDGQRELLNALIAVGEKWRRFCAEARPSLSENLKVATDLVSKAVNRVQAIATSELAAAAGKTRMKAAKQ